MTFWDFADHNPFLFFFTVIALCSAAVTITDKLSK